MASRMVAQTPAARNINKRKDFSNLMQSMHRQDSSDEMQQTAIKKLLEYINHTKVSYAKMLSHAIGRDLDQNEIDKINSKTNRNCSESIYKLFSSFD